VDETIERLTAAGSVPPLIVVGIDHAGRRERAHEYLPYPDVFLQPPDPHPAGDRYPAFLVDEVLPFVDAHYRTIQDAAQRTLGGSSYGALAALYAVVVRPGVFGRLLLESPSLYVADARILQAVGDAKRLPDRVYIGVGTNESGTATCDSSGDGGDIGHDVQRLARLLVARGLTEQAVRVTVEPCGRHDESAWGRRLPDALRFLYGG
jgi:enterochelin esterase-like enzyme